jgi:hypothetical protein
MEAPVVTVETSMGNFAVECAPPARQRLKRAQARFVLTPRRRWRAARAQAVREPGAEDVQKLCRGAPAQRALRRSAAPRCVHSRRL